MDVWKDTAPGGLEKKIDPNALMVMLFTSGTTGRSKAVMLAERNFFTVMQMHVAMGDHLLDFKHRQLPEDKNDVLSNFAILPLFHLGTFICLFVWACKGWALNLSADIRDFYRDLGLMHSDAIAVAPMLMEAIYKDVKRGRRARLNGVWNPCGSSAMFDGAIGWRKTYVILGLALGVVLILAGWILRRPGADQPLPQAAAKESLQIQDFTTRQMLRRPSFWMAFLYLVFLSAVGSSVISFARDLALSVGATAGLATSLVGILSICNGLGRMVTGAAFDALGRRKTMLLANGLTICAAGAILVATCTDSLVLCVLGLCLTGLSYGSCSTTTATFPSMFYGMKHYPTNVACMTFNLMGGSLVATLSSLLLTATGGYVAPFLLLLGLTLAALGLNLAIRKP